MRTIGIIITGLAVMVSGAGAAMAHHAFAAEFDSTKPVSLGPGAVRPRGSWLIGVSRPESRTRLESNAWHDRRVVFDYRSSTTPHSPRKPQAAVAKDSSPKGFLATAAPCATPDPASRGRRQHCGRRPSRSIAR